MNWREENFSVITTEYRKKGAAAIAYRNLQKATPKFRKKILRNHRVKGIYKNEEVKYRDQVDELFQYYSIVEIGLLAGYTPFQLSYEKKKRATFLKEINTILGDVHVTKYYQRFYPLLLPKLLYKHAQYYYLHEIDEDELKNPGEESRETSSSTPNQSLKLTIEKGRDLMETRSFLGNLLKSWAPQRPYRQCFPVTNSADQDLFMQFLSLQSSIKTDDDIDTFLWFLDDGLNDGYGIHDVLKILGRPKEIAIALNSSRSWEAHGLRGFVKFCDYLVSYKALLDCCNEKPLLQSALWHYQSYWFSRMKSKMRGRLMKGLNNLSLVVNNRDEQSFNKDFNSELDLKDRVSYSEWQRESNMNIKLIENTLQDLLNPTYGIELRRFSKEIDSLKIDKPIKVKIEKDKPKRLR